MTEIDADRQGDHAGVVAGWRAMVQALWRPTDVAALVVFRVAIGLLVFVSAARFIAYGWIERFFIEPSFHFKYWGFDWVQVWPSWGMYLHVAVIGVLGLCIAAGAFYRVSTVLLFVAFSYFQLMDAALYLNHYYLVSLLSLLLIVLPLQRAASVDAWRDPSLRTATLPAWCTYLLRSQVALVYLYAGLAKLGSDWLVHAQPLNIWLQARSELPFVGPWMEYWWVAAAMSWCGFLFDTTIVAWLSWRRTRLFAYLVLVGFHITTGVLFDIGMFPWIMSVCALVFFSPSWPRTLRDRLAATLFQRGQAPKTAALRERVQPAETVFGSARRWGLAVAAAFLLLQALIPLRHLAYPGDVLWNEQGMRWSWKVKVREKNGALTYHVTLPSGRVQQVSPRRYLADFQEREMNSQPDMILQLAHHIAQDYRTRGYGDVEVRAEAWVSLNGRRAQLLVDRSVDLARVDDGIGRAAWITAAPRTAPRRLTRLDG